MRQILCFLIFLLCHFNNGLAADPSVIIVGAGPAGIAAATKLLENSFMNITILEAEDRIGGRVQSVIFGDALVDVGAQYCHGENIVYQMVKDLDLLEHVSQTYPTVLYYSNGSALDTSLTKELEDVILNYDDVIENKTSNRSLGEAFLEVYNSTILQKYSDDEQNFKIVSEAVIFANNLILMHEGAFGWDRPAADRDYEACPGDQMMAWKNQGYQIIMDVLMKSFPNPEDKLPIDDKILLNTKVEKITWNNNEVTATTSDNSIFTADHVIVTPSIGVLKEQKDTLFDPELPAPKLEAIEAIGIDAILKVILHFPDKWWRNEDQMFYFLWSEDDLKNIINEFPDGPSKDGISWVSHIVALVQVAANPNALIAWVSGDLIPEIEQTSEQTVLDGTMYVINKFLGKDYNITAADQVLRSQWYTNPNFRGTYSYERTGYWRENFSYQAQLAEPLSTDNGIPVVLFAGEATHSNHYSTVHGAIESGQREAQRIIDLYNQ